MKKLFFATLILILGFAPHVLAEGFTALAPIPGLTQSTTSVVDPTTLSTFLNSLYKYLVGLAAAIAVVQIIWAGLNIALFHRDAVSELGVDKGKITNAVFGLILVLSPVLVFSIINPSILNLTLNLPAIETLTTKTDGGGTNAGQQWCYFRSIVAGEGDSICSPTEQACNAGRTADEKLYEVTLCSMSAATAPSTCSVSGTAGILQIATCPSSAAATAWGQQSCTNGNLFEGPQTALANKTVTSIVKICTGKNPYVFINKLGTLSGASSIDMLQPLARTTDNPNNGASAIQFVNICNKNLGRKTCISRAPALGWASDCNPTPSTSLPSGIGIGKCYNETLTCEDKNIISNDTCSASPSWTPFN